MASEIQSIRNLSNIRKLALSIVLVFYLIGGYGVASSLLDIAFVAWQVVLVLALWSGAFGFIGWLVFNVNT